jgi:hypothetical protein
MSDVATGHAFAGAPRAGWELSVEVRRVRVRRADGRAQSTGAESMGRAAADGPAARERSVRRAGVVAAGERRMSGGRSGEASGRERSHQRCYRRVWIERRTGARYEGVRAIVRRVGFSMRSVSDRDIERIVRATREERRERRAQVDRVARAVGRSRRWVSEAARRLGIELSEDAIGRLGEERDRVERGRRERIGRGRRQV